MATELITKLLTMQVSAPVTLNLMFRSGHSVKFHVTEINEAGLVGHKSATPELKAMVPFQGIDFMEIAE